MFLNDDTVAVDPGWLRELVGWAQSARHRPRRAAAARRRRATSSTAASSLGLEGFADHLFQGMTPGDDTLLGSTRWYRDVAVGHRGVRRDPAATSSSASAGSTSGSSCAAATSCSGSTPPSTGCGTSCCPHGDVRHLESATRGTNVPEADFFASSGGTSSWLRRRRSATSRRTSRSRRRARAARPADERPGHGAGGGAGRPALRRVPADHERRGEPHGSRRSAARTRRLRRRVEAGARRHRRAPAGPHRQLVPPRHRQPVLRRHQHRLPHRRPAGRATTASRTASS